ncbi:phospholipase A2-like [Pseudophryne corroboree]|uniref:phospholipase A2-like n=1 Tax=Pseudophryne corroboree TaxID=495146 RepID=UPI003081AB6D
MAPSRLVLFLCVALVGQTDGDLTQFWKMVYEVTGRWPILTYAFYGCFCGVGGSGWPVDDIDWCCHIHDCCFENVMWRGCNPKTVRYKFNYGDATCADSDLYGCARQTCECDRQAALCFKNNDEKYSMSRNFYAKKIKCYGFQPLC